MELVGIFIVIIILLVSLVIHEVAHGLVAYWLGDDTAKIEGRLTLNPLAHVEPVLSVVIPALCIMANSPIIGGAKPVPVNYQKIKWHEWGVALVALAGPLTNFILAFVAYGIFSILNISSGLLGGILLLFVNINLGLMLFNLLPLPPLDGSKIIFPIAPDFIQDIIQKMESNSLLVFFVIIIFSNYISAGIHFVESYILTFFQWIF